MTIISFFKHCINFLDFVPLVQLLTYFPLSAMVIFKWNSSFFFKSKQIIVVRQRINFGGPFSFRTEAAQVWWHGNERKWLLILENRCFLSSLTHRLKVANVVDQFSAEKQKENSAWRRVAILESPFPPTQLFNSHDLLPSVIELGNSN